MTTRIGTPEAPLETRRAHLHLAREAGFGKISGFSAGAGIFAAIGALAIAIGVVAAVLAAAGVDSTGMSDDEWKQAGAVVAVVGVLVVGGAWWFGGYVAGRMARRAGAAHGALVAAWGTVVLALAGVVALILDGGVIVSDRLGQLGIPTTADDWAAVGVITAAATVVAMFVGAVFGARRGERWHQRLVARAFDPEVGPEAALRADAERRRLAAEAANADALRPDEQARLLASERNAASGDAEVTTSATDWPGLEQRRPAEPGPADDATSGVTILHDDAEVDPRRVTPA